MLHFSDVARACARRVIANAVRDRGDEWVELPEDHTVERKWHDMRRNSVARAHASHRQLLDRSSEDAESEEDHGMHFGI